MQPYRHPNGNTGVIAYRITARAITVQFAGGAIYVYSYASAGAARVEEMKRLAVAGRGLATFISQHVQHAYAAKR